MKPYTILALSVLVMGAADPGGCVQKVSPGDITNVCDALSANANVSNPGPIRYNTKSNKNGRLAGKVLALDLATRNRVGSYLHCRGF